MTRTTPTFLRIARYRLRHWGILRTHPGAAIPRMDPATIPAVAQPIPDECYCCWYQSHYGPLPRPDHLIGQVPWCAQALWRRLLPPIKPDRISGLCEAHIERLYPPKRRTSTEGAARREGEGHGHEAVGTPREEAVAVA
jgi:hypothetical protein